MCAIQWFILKSCIFGLCISVTEAGVVLETSDGRTTYLIGSKVELVCSITPYNDEMTWFVNNDPYADCTAGTCKPYSNKAYAFAFTFNETAGIFKLAISSVTHSHADLLFACADGIERKPISFNVTTVANEGNGDNDDRTLGEGAIAGIVVGIVVPIAVIIVVYLYKRNQRAAAEAAAQYQAHLAEQRNQRAAAAEAAAQYQAHLAEQRDQRAAAAEAAAQHQAQQAEQRRKEQLEKRIKVLMSEPENFCIIMKGLLRIEELSEKIVKQTKIMFSSPLQAQPHNSRLRHIYHIRDVNQLYEEKEIDQMRESIRREQQEGACDAHIKKALVESATISSFVMRGFSEEFFDYMILRLQQNTDIYQKIEADIQKNEIANDDQMRIEH